MGNTQAKLTPGRQWADAPFQLLESIRKRDGITDVTKETFAQASATEMVLVHNVMIRGLNSIYLQAPNIKEQKDVADFVVYLFSWSLMLHAHHHTEESTAFPLLEKYTGVENLMGKNVDQHRLFEPGLEAFDQYITALKAGKENYDGKKVCTIIDSFGPTLVSHLTEEIATIEGLEQYGDKIDWKSYNKAIQKEAVDEGDTEHGIPFFIANIDSTFEHPFNASSWPPFPWFVALICRWVYIPKHKEAWRFGSCDSYGVPKDLPFV